MTTVHWTPRADSVSYQCCSGEARRTWRPAAHPPEGFRSIVLLVRHSLAHFSALDAEKPSRCVLGLLCARRVNALNVEVSNILLLHFYSIAHSRSSGCGRGRVTASQPPEPGLCAPYPLQQAPLPVHTVLIDSVSAHLRHVRTSESRAGRGTRPPRRSAVGSILSAMLWTW